MIRVGLPIVVVLSLAGCTFRAPQLEAALAAFNARPTVDEEVAALAWQLDWLGSSSTVYPAIIKDTLAFANAADVFIVFDGWQVTAVGGLLPGQRRMRIDVSKDRTELRFAENGRSVGAVRCAPWSSEVRQDGARIWTQACTELEADNVIVVDPAGASIELRFTIHPDYPPIRLSKGSSASS